MRTFSPSAPSRPGGGLLGRRPGAAATRPKRRPGASATSRSARSIGSASTARPTSSSRSAAQPSVRAEGDAAAIERLDIAVEDGDAAASACRRRRLVLGGHRGSHRPRHRPGAADGASIGGSGDMRIDRVQGAALRGVDRRLGRSWTIARAARRRGQLLDRRLGRHPRRRRSAAAADISIAGSGSISARRLRDPPTPTSRWSARATSRSARPRRLRCLDHGLGRRQCAAAARAAPSRRWARATCTAAALSTGHDH